MGPIHALLRLNGYEHAEPGESGVEFASLLSATSPALLDHVQIAQDETHVIPPVPSIGVVPGEWIRWVDERSSAGEGHGARLAQLCELLIGKDAEANLRAHLQKAAHVHEIGLMSGVATDPVELAERGAALLSDLGSASNVARIVRHMHERWDGSGGPDQLRSTAIPTGAAVLSVADAIDHHSAAWIHAGVDPIEAVERALDVVSAQQGTRFSPELARAVVSFRSEIRIICAVPRPLPAASTWTGVYPTIAKTLLGRLS